MNGTDANTKPLHAELPAPLYKALKQRAEAEGRTLKGELTRIIKLAYGIPAANEAASNEPAAATTGAA